MKCCRFQTRRPIYISLLRMPFAVTPEGKDVDDLRPIGDQRGDSCVQSAVDD